MTASIILTPAELAQVRNLCRKCGHPITTKYRFGSAATGWEHMVDECPTGVPSGRIVTPGDRELDWINGGYVTVAPVRWTALEGPCETCGGDVLMAGTFGVDPLGLRRCPDCVNGRKRIELREPCGQLPESHHDGDDCYYGCDPAKGFTLLVARATIEVLPVKNIWRLIVGDGWRVRVPDQRYFDVTVEPVPGRDWVVVLSDVEYP